jgi:tRNA(Arg) A34 adenosine deaminase TadA
MRIYLANLFIFCSSFFCFTVSFHQMSLSSFIRRSSNSFYGHFSRRHVTATPNSMDEVFMKLALRNAQNAARDKEVPIGAVLVDKDNTVIATARNSVEECYDATAHAEMECLRKASRLLKNWRLQDCTLYTTVEPCAMCLSAIQSFRVKRLGFFLFHSRLSFLIPFPVSFSLRCKG